MKRSKRRLAERLVVGVAVVAWVVFLIGTQIAFAFGVLTFVCFSVLVIGSAIRHRGAGWAWGVILGLMLLTLPIWVLGAAQLYEALSVPFPNFFRID